MSTAVTVKHCVVTSVELDLVNQSIGTVGGADWMAEMMLNTMMVFADAEQVLALPTAMEADTGVPDRGY